MIPRLVLVNFYYFFKSVNNLLKIVISDFESTKFNKANVFVSDFIVQLTEAKVLIALIYRILMLDIARR